MPRCHSGEETGALLNCRLVQLTAAAARRTEDGQHPADRRELHDPVVAGIRDPDVPGRVGGDSGRLVQVLSERDDQARGR